MLNPAPVAGDQPAPSVLILLCTCQGATYLAAQLASIAHQHYPHWVLYGSDDVSSDDTLTVLRSFAEQVGDQRVNIGHGPGQGSTANFLHLTRAVAGQARYYAWCDQDDVWEADKLQRAVAWLDQQPPDSPLLYCGRTRLIDGQDKVIGFSPMFTRPPCFRNALAQNIAGGNTMVFNEAACRLITAIPADVSVPLHDWWAYLVVTACGGIVKYDPWPGVRYRQHGANQVGSNTAPRVRLKRLRNYLNGCYSTWTARNLEALLAVYPGMTPENRRVFDGFRQLRTLDNRWQRLGQLHASGIFRQTLAGHLGLFLLALTGQL